ncbi:WSC domain-containing protein [Hypoxylon argillaceum]|nr:WSC domain-containing protein [Hypoxylon argillaceum]
MVAIKSVAAIAALSLVNTAQAWYNDLPSCLSPFEPFVYTGCYDNGQVGQPEALSLRTDLDQQNMTVEICVAHCKGNDYRLAGLSYYGVCYCGETVSTALLPEDQCTFPCSGNSSETCGGDTQINIWMDPTFPPLSEQTSITEYVPVGCWTDDSSDGKALFYRQDNLDTSTLTTELCLQSCLSGGFPFAGTEYAGECYCGVVVGNGTALASDASTCNMPCNGNSSEICGGPARLSLYVAKDLQSLEPCGTPPDTSSTITTTTTTSTTTPPPSSTSTSTTTTSTTTTSSSTTTTTTKTTTGYPTTKYPTTTTTSCTTTTSTTKHTTKYPTTKYPTTKYPTTKYPTTTTTTKSTTKHTTTTTAPVCTSTSVTPSNCEYSIGKWCSNPVPNWTDKKSCLVSWSQCALQGTSCFLKAGFPDSLSCFDYTTWCAELDIYCLTTCLTGDCSKSGFVKKYPAKGGLPPTTSTSTYPCPTTVVTTTTKATTTTAGYPTSSCPVATPTGICTQPSSSKYGYGPGHPVGGIPLPVVTCNNIKSDWSAGNVFKMYSDEDSSKCPSYPRPQCPSACADACETQYEQCEDVYTEGCKTGKFGQSSKDADAACKAQYSDCLAINKNVKGTGQCTSWSDGC